MTAVDFQQVMKMTAVNLKQVVCHYSYKSNCIFLEFEAKN
jgi:hypothetical protein